jgi:calreticulin
MMRAVIASALVAAASAKTLYKETFDDGWDKRWVTGAAGDKSLGEWKHTAGEYYGGDEAAAKGIETSDDMRHYFLATKMDEFSNKGSDLVIQSSLKYTQTPECGGSYIKLLGAGADPAAFDNDTPYSIMFGPDQCGGTKRVHAIITYKDENVLKTSDVTLSIYDELTHLYSFVIKSDQTYEVFVDLESKASGSITDDWKVLAPKKIEDPDVSKPSDWVEEAMIDDPEDKKPEGWDDIAENIVDPEAEKPEDWDDEDDGEWEAPTISNPEYKGEWSAKRIDNPEYKGVWVHPEIDNPEFKEDPTLHEFTFGGLGFELWQTKAGSLFDNIIITDSWDEAKKFGEDTWQKDKDAEKEMKEANEKAAADAAAEDDDADDEEEDDEKEEL